MLLAELMPLNVRGIERACHAQAAEQVTACERSSRWPDSAFHAAQPNRHLIFVSQALPQLSSSRSSSSSSSRSSGSSSSSSSSSTSSSSSSSKKCCGSTPLWLLFGKPRSCLTPLCALSRTQHTQAVQPTLML